MPLEEYQRKRKFNQTPEPKGGEAKSVAARQAANTEASQAGVKSGAKAERAAKWGFVIQKHEATRLHYDFRLELDGALKSWAVPKGPSLDPADKRLAMAVEDHPLEYANFEGRIPEGNYGAGTVMVWDHGTWEPAGTEKMNDAEREAHARAMLAKGDLKFRLRGTKLRGEFVLAKMKSHRPGSKGTEWLLIKHRDDAVESGYRIEAHDGSALSGRSMEEIAEDKDSAEWSSNKAADARTVEDRHVSMLDWQKLAGEVKGARKAAMPKSVHPMLASLTEPPLTPGEWMYEVKWDGYRAIAYVEDGKAKLVSRNQNDLTEGFRELAERIPERVRAKRAVLDGEIVALDEQGRSSFSLMQQRSGLTSASPLKSKTPLKPSGATTETSETPADFAVPIVYYAFDLLWVEGWSLMGVALEDRKRLLREGLSVNEYVLYSEHFDDGEKLLEAAREQGLEGIVAKQRASHYEQKRSGAWRKVKLTQTQECVIGGWTEPKGSRQYFGSLLMGLYDAKGRLRLVGHAGSGFTRKSEAEMFKLLKPLETKKNPFANKVENLREVHFVRPELVAEVKFAEWTHEGENGVKLRAPVFVGLRTDKAAKECRAA